MDDLFAVFDEKEPEDIEIEKPKKRSLDQNNLQENESKRKRVDEELSGEAELDQEEKSIIKSKTHKIKIDETRYVILRSMIFIAFEADPGKTIFYFHNIKCQVNNSVFCIILKKKASFVNGMILNSWLFLPLI